MTWRSSYLQFFESVQNDGKILFHSFPIHLLDRFSPDVPQEIVFHSSPIHQFELFPKRCEEIFFEKNSLRPEGHGNVLYIFQLCTFPISDTQFLEYILLLLFIIDSSQTIHKKLVKIEHQ